MAAGRLDEDLDRLAAVEARIEVAHVAHSLDLADVGDVPAGERLVRVELRRAVIADPTGLADDQRGVALDAPADVLYPEIVGHIATDEEGVVGEVADLERVVAVPPQGLPQYGEERLESSRQSEGGQQQVTLEDEMLVDLELTAIVPLPRVTHDLHLNQPPVSLMFAIKYNYTTLL